MTSTSEVQSPLQGIPASRTIRDRIQELTQERATLTKLLKVAIEVEKAAPTPRQPISNN